MDAIKLLPQTHLKIVVSKSNFAFVEHVASRELAYYQENKIHRGATLPTTNGGKEKETAINRSNSF